MIGVPKPIVKQKKRKGVKRENVARSAREFTRAFGSAERISFVSQLPSVVSGAGPCVNAHVRGGGAGRRADARWIVPMTDGEHRMMHQMGQTTFAKLHHLDLDALAEETNRAWEQHATPSPESRP